ncbi:MAG: caspase family protein [Planctomycetales bacterium]|nr:caspase family protein [Planctomycetales bacterium]
MEEIRNERPSYQVRVSVDHADRLYKGGEVMKVSVTSGQAGYLYLFYCDASGEASCLFPNKHQTDNAIPANRTVRVPARTSSFRLRVGAPYGEEVLKAVVAKRPLKSLDLASLTKGDVTPIDLDKAVRAVRVEYADRPAEWAEHDVKITTVEPNQAHQRQHRRVGLFVGISDFQTVNDLTICHLDAQRMARVMQRQGRLDEAVVLVNEQATLDAIRNALRRLARTTRAGDEVFVFWSGHGGQCSDDNGDEEDGYDEFLVPYDARTDSLDALRRTMLLDDTFGRWMQDFDGRKVVVILDACYSGGQSAAAKGLSAAPGVKNGVAFDFFSSELARGKDIGQQETALLCSSQADEVSYERNEDDLSVMTYCLVEQLERAPRLTLPEAYQKVSAGVASYLGPGSSRRQTPALYDNTTPPVYLKP